MIITNKDAVRQYQIQKKKQVHKDIWLQICQQVKLQEQKEKTNGYSRRKDASLQRG